MNDNNMEKLISKFKSGEMCENEFIIQVCQYTPAAVPSKSESGLREFIEWAEHYDWGNRDFFTKAKEILSRHPAPPEEIEPLAVKHLKALLKETECLCGMELGEGVSFTPCAYCEARAYLSSLPDVKEGK